MCASLPSSRPGIEPFMYIGIGAVLLILLIVGLVMLARRA
jgi:hypothetical protein